MRILALDPATKCGWAARLNGFLCSGTWDLTRRRDESDGMKLVRFRAKLNELAAELKPTLVVFEAARHGATKMQGALVHQSKMQGVLEAWCADNGFEYKGYSPSEIKKYATGKGNAKKELVTAAVQERWGLSPGGDDNEADAIALLELARSEYGGA